MNPVLTHFPRALLRAGLQHQRRHPWQLLLALTGICMGVAVVLAVDLANQAAKASFELSASQLRGAATHRIYSPAGNLPQSLYSELFTTPGHPPMTPVIQTSVRIPGNAGRFRLLGIDLLAEDRFARNLPAAADGNTDLTDWLTTPSAVAISQRLADRLGVSLNEPLRIALRGQTQTLDVMLISSQELPGSDDLLVVDIATAQEITGQLDQLSQIDLLLDDNQQEWITQRLPDFARLVEIDQQTEGIVGLSAAFELNLTAMSLLALLVGLFLIYNAISFSVVQRRQLLGRLRAIGVVPVEIQQAILVEALLVGVLGSLLGVLLGYWLGQGLTGIVAATVSELYYSVSQDAAQLSLLSLVKAVLLGLLGTLAAAWLPARQAAKTPPLTSLSRNALEQHSRQRAPQLAAAGLVLIAIGLAIAYQLPGGLVSAFAGLFVLVLGAVMLTPLALLVARHLLARLNLGTTWHMTVRDLQRHLSRLSTAAAALMVALSATVGVSVMVDSMRTAVSDWLGELLTGDLYIAASGFEDGALLPDSTLTRVRQFSSLDAVGLYRDRVIELAGRKSRLVAVELPEQARQGFQIVSGSPRLTWQAFDAGGVLISEPLAHRLELDAGDNITLPALNGPVDFPIAGVFRDYASEHGRLFMPLPAYRLAWQDNALNTLALFARGSPDKLSDEARSALQDLDTLVFTDANAIYDASMTVFERTFRITEVLRLLSILVAFIGILSALMALQLERRKEYAVLRAVGMTRLQVSAMILAGSLWLGLLAALLALPTGLMMAWLLTDVVQYRAFGWTLPFNLPLAVVPQTLLTGLLAAFLAGLYPAWRASQADPAPQLRED